MPGMPNAPGVRRRIQRHAPREEYCPGMGYFPDRGAHVADAQVTPR